MKLRRQHRDDPFVCLEKHHWGNLETEQRPWESCVVGEKKEKWFKKQ